MEKHSANTQDNYGNISRGYYSDEHWLAMLVATVCDLCIVCSPLRYGLTLYHLSQTSCIAIAFFL